MMRIHNVFVSLLAIASSFLAYGYETELRVNTFVEQRGNGLFPFEYINSHHNISIWVRTGEDLLEMIPFSSLDVDANAKSKFRDFVFSKTPFIKRVQITDGSSVLMVELFETFNKGMIKKVFSFPESIPIDKGKKLDAINIDVFFTADDELPTYNILRGNWFEVDYKNQAPRNFIKVRLEYGAGEKISHDRFYSEIISELDLRGMYYDDSHLVQDLEDLQKNFKIVTSLKEVGDFYFTPPAHPSKNTLVLVVKTLEGIKRVHLRLDSNTKEIMTYDPDCHREFGVFKNIDHLLFEVIEGKQSACFKKKGIESLKRGVGRNYDEMARTKAAMIRLLENMDLICKDRDSVAKKVAVSGFAFRNSRSRDDLIMYYQVDSAHEAGMSSAALSYNIKGIVRLINTEKSIAQYEDFGSFLKELEDWQFRVYQKAIQQAGKARNLPISIPLY